MKVPHHPTGTTVDINTSHFHIFFILAKIKCYEVHIDRSRTYQRCLLIAWVHSYYFIFLTNLKMFQEMDEDVVIKQHTSSTVADMIPWSSSSAILALGCEVFSGWVPMLILVSFITRCSSPVLECCIAHLKWCHENNTKIVVHLTSIT